MRSVRFSLSVGISIQSARMILHTVAITTAVAVALVAIGGYSPLVDPIEDRYRALLFLGSYKLLRVTPFEISEWLGFGSFFDYIGTLQRMEKPDLSLPPTSASYGDMNVTRGGLAGRPVIIYRPKDMDEGELLPALIYLHGGGWSLHNPDVYDRPVHDIANCTRKITISVGYRLAPKHPFPVPVQDCLDVTKHILKTGKTLGIDVNRVGIAGDGAGGNMAAAVALRLSNERNPGLPPLKYQALLYPTLQGLNFRLPSFVEIGESIPILGVRRMAGHFAMYMGLDPAKMDEYADLMIQNRHVSPQLLHNSKYSEYVDVNKLPPKFRKPRPEVMRNHALTEKEETGKDKKKGSRDSKHSSKDSPAAAASTLSTKDSAKASKLSAKDFQLFNRIKHHLTNPLLSPLMSPDLHGLPSTLVLVAEFDVLRDDGLLYAHRLREAGVKTEVFIGKGYHDDFFHSFPDYFHSKTGKRTTQSMCLFMRREAKPKL